jgi:hypothetical protein
MCVGKKQNTKKKKKGLRTSCSLSREKKDEERLLGLICRLIKEQEYI